MNWSLENAWLTNFETTRTRVDCIIPHDLEASEIILSTSYKSESIPPLCKAHLFAMYGLVENYYIDVRGNTSCPEIKQGPYLQAKHNTARSDAPVFKANDIIIPENENDVFMAIVEGKPLANASMPLKAYLSIQRTRKLRIRPVFNAADYKATIELCEAQKSLDENAMNELCHYLSSLTSYYHFWKNPVPEFEYPVYQERKLGIRHAKRAHSLVKAVHTTTPLSTLLVHTMWQQPNVLYKTGIGLVALSDIKEGEVLSNAISLSLHEKADYLKMMRKHNTKRAEKPEYSLPEIEKPVVTAKSYAWGDV